MVLLPGGAFLMGSDDFYPEERPRHPVRISPFLLDRTPVTMAAFASFVERTGYVTVAEREPDPRHYPAVDPSFLVPGALVFTGTDRPVPLHDPSRWWRWVPGASWRCPGGPGPGPARPDHPVTQVSLGDAHAYARWVGRRLPTEAEHEFASRSGTEGTVWEWTADRWTSHHPDAATSPCCVPRDPRRRHSGPAAPRDAFVVKGGSHVCAPEYCLRYRPAARQPQDRDSAATHLGFRCARDLEPAVPAATG